jgi:site-specific recombinase XerD
MEDLLSVLARFDLPTRLVSRLTRYRVHLIAEVMYASGIRASEAAGLRPEDIDFPRGLLVIREGKGGASRVAYLSFYSLQVLRLYLDRLRPLIHARRWARGDRLFGCDWRSFGKLVNRSLQAITAERSLSRFTSHAFRHALGYHLHRAGCPIRHIQQILGHKRLRNTEVYTQVDREELREVLEAFHPRRGKR